MTNDLVEHMVGHRTRLAQESPRTWHEVEDQSLDRYLKLSESLDRVANQLTGFGTRGWIAVGSPDYPCRLFQFSIPRSLAVGLAGVARPHRLWKWSVGRKPDRIDDRLDPVTRSLRGPLSAG
jgi:ATP-binding cassette subfamily B protein